MARKLSLEERTPVFVYSELEQYKNFIERKKILAPNLNLEISGSPKYPDVKRSFHDWNDIIEIYMITKDPKDYKNPGTDAVIDGFTGYYNKIHYKYFRLDNSEASRIVRLMKKWSNDFERLKYYFRLIANNPDPYFLKDYLIPDKKDDDTEYKKKGIIYSGDII